MKSRLYHVAVRNVVLLGLIARLNFTSPAVVFVLLLPFLA